MTDTDKIDFSLIKSATTVLHSLNCPINEDFKAMVREHLTRKIREDGARRCAAIRGLLKAITRLLEANDGWLPLADGSFYYAKLDAVLPAPVLVSSTACSKLEQTPFSASAYKSLTVGSQKLPARVPSYGELNEILSSDSLLLPYPEASCESFYFVELQPETTVDADFEKYLESSGLTAFHDGKSFGIYYMNGYTTNDRKLEPFTAYAPSSSHAKGQMTSKPPLITVIPIARLHHGEIHRQLAPHQILHRWLQYGLTPASTNDLPEDSVYEVLDSSQVKDWKQLAASYNAVPSLFKLNTSTLFDVDDYVSRYQAGESLFGEETMEAELQTVLERLKKRADGEAVDFVTQWLLDADGIRANIYPPFSLTRLTTPQEGLWDLWGDNLPREKAKETIRIRTEVYARNPKADIQLNGVIGIDFGTKSTTVVRRAQNQPDMPLRIGVTDYTRPLTSSSEYENPTVMQFISLDDFCKAYTAWPGRPPTKWEHLTVSHTAASTLKNCRQSQLFSTFLTELKQWAGDAGRRTLCFRDQAGHNITLPPYRELLEDDFDPIEVYAYYLGLTINNPRNHGIYLCYELSYPVTYNKETRDRLKASFERGLKKSLPKTILDDAELMRRFRVNLAASEPAAYAICALREFGFRPRGREADFYGVFDFGGGTTDFDYGIYRHADEDDDDVDYILQHFHTSGDRYLGGENLLQLMAFKVFYDNINIFRAADIPVARPNDAENTYFVGDELVDDSPEAHLNLSAIMSLLRPIWERRDADDDEDVLSADNRERAAAQDDFASSDSRPRSWPGQSHSVWRMFRLNLTALKARLSAIDVQALEKRVVAFFKYDIRNFCQKMQKDVQDGKVLEDLTHAFFWFVTNLLRLVGKTLRLTFAVMTFLGTRCWKFLKYDARLYCHRLSEAIQRLRARRGMSPTDASAPCAPEPSTSVKRTSIDMRLMSKYDQGIQPVLISRQGRTLSDVTLGNIDIRGLESMLRKRIEHGVKQFFHSMKETFDEPSIPDTVTRINIFLAGNSCKSPIVKELMDQYAEEFKKDIAKKLGGDCPYEIKVFPPLGSDEAFELIRRQRGEEAVPRDVQERLRCPTGKTGVAFGLVIGRKGSSDIRVIDQRKEEEQDGNLAFRWYVGRAREGLLKSVIHRGKEKEQWFQLLRCVHDDEVEILYSAEAEARTDKLPAERAKTIRVHLPDSAIGCPLFICWTDANTIQLIAAESLDGIRERDMIDLKLI